MKTIIITLLLACSSLFAQEGRKFQNKAFGSSIQYIYSLERTSSPKRHVLISVLNAGGTKYEYSMVEDGEKWSLDEIPEGGARKNVIVLDRRESWSHFSFGSRLANVRIYADGNLGVLLYYPMGLAILRFEKKDGIWRIKTAASAYFLDGRFDDPENLPVTKMELSPEGDVILKHDGRKDEVLEIIEGNTNVMVDGKEMMVDGKETGFLQYWRNENGHMKLTEKRPNRSHR